MLLPPALSISVKALLGQMWAVAVWSWPHCSPWGVESWRDSDRAVQTLGPVSLCPGGVSAYEEQVPVGRCQFNLKAFFQWSHCCLSSVSEITGLWSGPKRENIFVWLWSISRNSWSGLLELQLAAPSRCLSRPQHCLSSFPSESPSAASLGRWLCEEQSSRACQDVTSVRAAVCVTASPLTHSFKLFCSPEESCCLVPWG